MNCTSGCFQKQRRYSFFAQAENGGPLVIDGQLTRICVAFSFLRSNRRKAKRAEEEMLTVSLFESKLESSNNVEDTAEPPNSTARDFNTDEAG
mmetsp:Transcript_28551/g.111794  ORF Transcript_28551/g.111794 Transcript_28551/m.111794 type:complete len:93 (+) Transcript_28551:907-1185(+)